MTGVSTISFHSAGNEKRFLFFFFFNLLWVSFLSTLKRLYGNDVRSITGNQKGPLMEKEPIGIDPNR